jgi:flagellar protein FliL
MAEATTPPAKKGGLLNLLLLGGISVIAGAAGFAAPMVLGHGNFGFGGGTDNTTETTGSKTAFISFGEVTVNLAEERLTRYLRVKIILVVDAPQEKAVDATVKQQKVVLKNWVISHLSDKSLEEVKGASGVNRLRREIQDQFNSVLFPDGTERIRDVLFDEFVVQ